MAQRPSSLRLLLWPRHPRLPEPQLRAQQARPSAWTSSRPIGAEPRAQHLGGPFLLPPPDRSLRHAGPLEQGGTGPLAVKEGLHLAQQGSSRPAATGSSKQGLAWPGEGRAPTAPDPLPPCLLPHPREGAPQWPGGETPQRQGFSQPPACAQTPWQEEATLFPHSLLSRHRCTPAQLSSPPGTELWPGEWHRLQAGSQGRTSATLLRAVGRREAEGHVSGGGPDRGGRELVEVGGACGEGTRGQRPEKGVLQPRLATLRAFPTVVVGEAWLRGAGVAAGTAQALRCAGCPPARMLRPQAPAEQSSRGACVLDRRGTSGPGRGWSGKRRRGGRWDLRVCGPGWTFRIPHLPVCLWAGPFDRGRGPGGGRWRRG